MRKLHKAQKVIVEKPQSSPPSLPEKDFATIFKELADKVHKKSENEKGKLVDLGNETSTKSEVTSEMFPESSGEPKMQEVRKFTWDKSWDGFLDKQLFT
ncbi:hypothetical protein RCL_jg26592.t1 [Rhizophagus clarus]|uniref:Uncharacterized protein n=1 Tax=Rhizophagus clarus TaxID=94130 RepID=A0A8H3LIM5_9GLOM|nr:hypothetical protein RCL_jg26592.t1 [Rhizophagus clarus]